MRALSKSKLIAYRQCPKRLWLEVHRPDLREDSSATQAVFAAGHQVGELAQRLYDPKGIGEVIDLKADGIGSALEKTLRLTQGDGPIFEAGFCTEGALAFTDVLLRDQTNGSSSWRMVEVKSSTSIKPYQIDDVAIQSLTIQSAGVNLASAAIAYIDKNWVYPGGGKYQGFLIEQDLTSSAFQRKDEVKVWIKNAQQIVAQSEPPAIDVGTQCESPYPCGFSLHCANTHPEVEYPVEWLPRIQSKRLKDFLADTGVRDMRQIPDALLSGKQRRVRDVTVSGVEYFDSDGACLDLSRHSLPAYFLDFETIQFAIPRWPGTKPFQMVPFQFSLHRLDEDGMLTHHSFLNTSGNDPSLAFVEALLGACSEPLPIFIYNLSFEGARLRELAQRFPPLANDLDSLCDRFVDLLPVAEKRYYHPSQKGSWSIKKLLPAIAPELNHDRLCGVQDGRMAMESYLQAINPDTEKSQVEIIRIQLIEYCKLDTLATVEIWKKFSKSNKIIPSEI